MGVPGPADLIAPAVEGFVRAAGPPLVGFRVRAGADGGAAWVWLLIEDVPGSSRMSYGRLQPIASAARSAAMEAMRTAAAPASADAFRPYVMFRSKAEQDDLERRGMG